MRHTDIAEVPRFGRNMSYMLFSMRISLNKPKFRSLLAETAANTAVREVRPDKIYLSAGIQRPIYCKPRLMFTASRSGNILPGKRLPVRTQSFIPKR